MSVLAGSMGQSWHCRPIAGHWAQCPPVATESLRLLLGCIDLVSSLHPGPAVVQGPLLAWLHSTSGLLAKRATMAKGCVYDVSSQQRLGPAGPVYRISIQTRHRAPIGFEDTLGVIAG